MLRPRNLDGMAQQPDHLPEERHVSGTASLMRG